MFSILSVLNDLKDYFSHIAQGDSVAASLLFYHQLVHYICSSTISLTSADIIEGWTDSGSLSMQPALMNYFKNFILPTRPAGRVPSVVALLCGSESTVGVSNVAVHIVDHHLHTDRH